jgi:hypothetical protein
MNEGTFWNLDVNVAIDEGNIVEWPDGPRDHVLPPLMLFAYFSHDKEVPQTWRPPLGKRLRPSLVKLLNPRYKAIEMIFKTGNKVPTTPFHETFASLHSNPDEDPSTSVQSLARWRSDKEFRACLCLHQIHLWHDGTQTKFSMSGFGEIGWTPPPVEAPDDRSPFPNLSGTYTQGSGYIEPERVLPRWDDWGVQITVEIGFRIKELLPRIGNRLLFFGGVPFMRMYLDLKIRTDGKHEGLFNGSYIPTQLYQVGQGIYTYDMIRDIGGFKVVKKALGIGFKVPAPIRSTAHERPIP